MDTSQFTEKVIALNKAMEQARKDKDTELYNSLVREYNTLIESEAIAPSEPNAQSDSIGESETYTPEEVINTRIESNQLNLRQKHIGVLNVLTGIVNNCRKGKYNDIDKQYLIARLHSYIQQLNEIDAETAKKEREERVKTYSSIASRL